MPCQCLGIVNPEKVIVNPEKVIVRREDPHKQGLSGRVKGYKSYSRRFTPARTAFELHSQLIKTKGKATAKNPAL